MVIADQPVINRKDGLKLLATFKRIKSDEGDENGQEPKPLSGSQEEDLAGCWLLEPNAHAN